MLQLLFNPEKTTFENIPTLKSILACFLMTTVYVGSLYLWRQENRYKRNDPDVIKRRFVSVGLSCVFSLILLSFLGESSSQTEYFLAEWIGFRFNSPLNMLKSSFVALFLTMVLFLGPLVQYLITHTDYNNNTQKSASSKSVINFKKPGNLVLINNKIFNFSRKVLLGFWTSFFTT